MAKHARHAQSHRSGYLDINMEVVWNTVQTALPELLNQLLLISKTGDLKGFLA